MLSDGKIVSDVRLSAGLVGTTVTAEQLFYNAPSRRRALKYPADEMNRIADVIVRYAIHNPLVKIISFATCPINVLPCFKNSILLALNEGEIHLKGQQSPNSLCKSTQRAKISY